MKLLTTMGTIIGIITGIWTIYSMDGSEKQFLSRVAMALLGVNGDRQANVAQISLKNSSDRPVTGTTVILAIPSANQGAAKVPTAAVAPSSGRLVELRVPRKPLSIGDDVQVCVLADGPLPFTHAFWIKQYQLARFMPKAGGHPLCSFTTAEMMRYLTLPPRMQAELKAGCVSPEFSDPERDYIPAATYLKDVSAREGWNVFVPHECD